MYVRSSTLVSHTLPYSIANMYVHMYCACDVWVSCWPAAILATSQSLDSVAEDKMLAQGITTFCNDLGLDPASLNVLVIAWVFKAATQCEFTRGEFVQGMTELA